MTSNLRISRSQQIITFIVRLIAFVVAVAPLPALLLPWVTLDGTREVRSGVEAVVMLASPMRDYLFTVDPLQASALTLGPVLIGLLAILISYRYYRRESIFWAPPAMLAAAVAIPYVATDLIGATLEGLDVVIAAAIFLMAHQILIRIQVFLARRQRWPRVYRTLAVAIGIGYNPWSVE